MEPSSLWLNRNLMADIDIQFCNTSCTENDILLGAVLTHWGRAIHICISKFSITGSDNGLWPSRHQAIIWTNAGILIIGPLGTNFIEILIEIYIFSFQKMHLKMSSGNWWQFCLGLNVLTHDPILGEIVHSTVMIEQKS